jgi:hypothetical protein
MLVFVSFMGLTQVDQIDNTNSKQQPPESVDADLNMIVPPQSFEASDAFNGYLSLQNSSAIIMVQINNSNYLRFADGMDEKFYAENKLHFISKESFVSENGVKGVYFKLWFELKGDRYIRYMVYAGDLSTTLWLNITYPEMLQELVEMEIIKSIKTINLKP